MWIRSQDKKHLCVVKDISIYFNDKINVNDIEFGTYRNIGRCIIILDEIQEKMFNCDKNYTYEMPSE